MSDKPEPGKQYRLTGAPGVASILNGNTWDESVVTPDRYPATRVALAVWSELKPSLQALWDAAETAEDVHDCESADHTARLDVVNAFLRDTSDVNGPSQVAHMTVADVRDLVRAFDATR